MCCADGGTSNRREKKEAVKIINMVDAKASSLHFQAARVLNIGSAAHV